jgi:3-isopropylmalate dehydrogenase
LKYENDDIGGAAYDRYGVPIRDQHLESAKLLMQFYLGAVGGENGIV